MKHQCEHSGCTEVAAASQKLCQWHADDAIKRLQLALATVEIRRPMCKAFGPEGMSWHQCKHPGPNVIGSASIWTLGNVYEFCARKRETRLVARNRAKPACRPCPVFWRGDRRSIRIARLQSMLPSVPVRWSPGGRKKMSTIPMANSRMVGWLPGSSEKNGDRRK